MESMNILNLFDNIEVENNKRLSVEDQEVVNKFDKTLKAMQEKFKLYLKFYEENKIYTIEKNYNSEKTEYIEKEIQVSIYSISGSFVKDIVFKEINGLIGGLYCYFKNKYQVNIECKSHDTDYYLEGREKRGKENLNCFLNITIDEIMDDIYSQLGGVNFEDKAINELIERAQKSTKQYKHDVKKVTIKGSKISIADFMWFDSWQTKYGEYNNLSKEEVKDILTLIEYAEDNQKKDKYIDLIESINDRNNTYVGSYLIDDSILKSVKTFKNGKFELNFKSGKKALDFARKYLNYQE